MVARILLFLFLSAGLGCGAAWDLLVYGDSAAAVAAAVEAKRLGLRVLLLSPEMHVGGMHIEGLGSADIDNHWFQNSRALGGIAFEFYERIGRKYGSAKPVYRFESKVAEAVFGEMLKGVEVLRGKRLREPLQDAVRWDRKGKLAAIVTEDGVRHEAKYFLDATIEADLLAAAGVQTVIGREANALYGEKKNGIRHTNTYRQFPFRVDPYRREGDPTSGLLPTIQDEALGEEGAADHRLQGYCFRSCLTQEAANRIEISKPADYKSELYEIYRRYARQGGELYTPQARLPNGKTDLGSWHDLSGNLYGMNSAYPGGDFATRRRVYEEHKSFVAGLYWFLAHDEALPETLRAKWRNWGLCKDEFPDNGGWPRRLYVRDARRMVNDAVIHERHTWRVNAVPVADPVAVAYWPTDTHHVRRIVRDGAAYNEGFVFDGDDWGPFGISYRAMIPREVENLLTPTALASSHVAYGAIRLEQTFLSLGQAAAVATSLALQGKQSYREVPYEALRHRLLERGQVLVLQLPEAKR